MIILFVTLGSLFLNQEEVTRRVLKNGMFHLAALPILTLVLFGGLSLFYKFAPRRKTTFSVVFLAALISTVLLQVCRQLFERCVYQFGNFDALYGTLTFIVVLPMWIYLSGVIIIFGGCLCAAQNEEPNPPSTS